jgi:beta-glucanase (GH16 family)
MNTPQLRLRLFVTSLVFVLSPLIVTAQNLGGWTLTFQDEFNGSALDTSKWNTCYEDQGPGSGTPCTLTGNNEMELYQPSGQVSEANGVLTIRGDKQGVVDPVTGAPYQYASGMLASWNKFSQTQGYFEMRAQLPPGTGLWPAFWMDNNNHTWPPEIDAVEMIGSMPDAPHVGAIQSPSGAYLAKYVYTFDTSTAYHTYGVEWDSNNLTYYYDGQQVAQTTAASNMTNPMQLIANLAIGGNWPGAPTPYTVFPAIMNIDYIRAWTRSSSTAAIPFTYGIDVGSPGLAGSSSLTTAGAATIQGAGSGYFSYATDSFQYAAQPIAGDTDFTMEVASVPAPNGAYTPQTGIMVRENMNANARYTAVFLANSKCILQSRTSTGGVATRIATLTGITYPSWLRLIRNNDAFSAYISSDGVSWNLVGTTQNDLSSTTMGQSAFVGAAVSSGNPSQYVTENISSFDLPAVQITQDNADSSGVSIVGNWTASTNNGGYYGPNYITDANANKGSMSVTFTPTLPSSGLYNVYFRWVGNETARATNVPVTVNASDGAHTIYVNEQHQGSEWVMLGAYSLDSSSSVAISNAGTTSTVSVDAVRFSPATTTPPLAPFAPAAPTGVASLGTPDASQVTIGWNPVDLVDSYNILRATSLSGPYTAIVTLLPSSLLRYNDTTVSPGTTYYYEVAGVNDSGQGATSSPVPAMASTIVDDLGATPVGSWTSSTSAATMYYASDYLQDGDTGSTGGKSVTYTPTLPVTGNYYVLMRWPAGSNRASNVPIDISANGSTTTINFNEQQANDVWWACLGNYSFPAGSSSYVKIRNDGADGYVIADAIEFVPNLSGGNSCPMETSSLRPPALPTHRDHKDQVPTLALVTPAIYTSVDTH